MLLAAGMAIALPAGKAGAADTDLTFDNNGKCTNTTSLRFIVGPDSDDAYFSDIKTAKVQVDLYKVADAMRETTTPTHGSMYVFKNGSDYGTYGVTGLETYDALKDLTNDDWRARAQTAANTLFGLGTIPAPTVSFSSGTGGVTEAKNVAAGLYLVIAHGADLTTAEYVVKDGADVRTVANSGLYEYTYIPELLALPTTASTMGVIVPGANGADPTVTYNQYKDADGNVHFGVSTAGKWQTELTAMLKPVREERLGDLKIVKNVLVYENSSPVTFTYRIVATKDGKTVFDDYRSITWPRESYVLIRQEFPVGASVTVTEDYPGAGYKPVGSTTAETTILPASAANAPAAVTFTNTYDNKTTNGYGIRNEFTFVKENDTDIGEWVLVQDPAPAVPASESGSK